MKKLRAVELDGLLSGFTHVEKAVSELMGKNTVLEVKLDETRRLMKLSQSREKYLKEERDQLKDMVAELQSAVEQQCDLREENETLSSALEDIKREYEAKLQESKVREDRLKRDLCELKERHHEELEDLHQEMQRAAEAKKMEMRAAVEMKETELEELRSKIMEQEKERHSELLKLQMEFSAKLARAQASQQAQKQHHRALPALRNVFHRKLQFLQEEKSREVAALRQQVATLQQQLSSLNPSYKSKRKKTSPYEGDLCRSSAGL
ncbi:coiled-coil domain-containing protein 152 [Scleropages formosus]|uniref:Coiled-coil domain-containing protein 152-like n=1 Tax=Scleropages formosus TaxID=113540 RepID=A0A8C9R3E7_SCLFO|nr:coiled-coil domain-containing protein 152 [Scleropages formosus]